MTLRDPYLWVDVLRFFLGIFAAWAAVLIMRAGWRRHQTQPDHPSLWFYASYALALLLLAALRWQHIGMPPTWDLWPATVIVGLAGVGVFQSWRLTRANLRAPHNRPDH